MSILEQDPKGRIDIAAVRVAETIIRGPVEKACNGLPLWDWGLGKVVEAVIVQAGFPSRPIDALDFAEAAGVVKPNRAKKAKKESVDVRA